MSEGFVKASSIIDDGLASLSGYEFDAVEAASPPYDSSVKPLTMDTLLDAKRLLQRGYGLLGNDCNINVRPFLGFGYKIRKPYMHHITS